MSTGKAFACILALVILLSLSAIFGTRAGEMDIWQRTFLLASVPTTTIFTYHQLPFWNPWVSGGMPHLAYPFSIFLSPGYIFCPVFGSVNGLVLRAIAGLFFGLCGGYLLGRRIAPGRYAPWLCAFVYGFSSWYPLYIMNWHMEFIPFLYLPWVLLFFHMGIERIRWCACGGAVFALMIIEGGSYPVPHTVLFLSLYALFEVMARRRWAPLGVFLAMISLGLALSAVKLIPVFEFLTRNPRLTFWREPLLPWHALPRMFFGRDQASPTDFKGAWLGWWEYGAYVGVIPVALACIAPFVTPKKAIPLLILALLFFSLIFGDFSAASPWHWLHALPVFSSLHDASRFRIMLVLSIAMMSGLAMSHFESRATRMRAVAGRTLECVLGGIILVALFDLILVSAPLYTGLAKPPEQGTARDGPFRQTRRAEHEQEHALPYICFLRNEGLIDNMGEMELPPADVRTYLDPGYRGEVWLERGRGSVETALWTPNRLSYRVKLTGPDILLINQRYDPGWRSGERRTVREWRGLLAISLDAGEHLVSLYYLPPYFIMGCGISMLGIIVSVIIWYYRPVK
ncbi:MAG: hypothetical protein NT045_00205 [Candidatus Aureabacteria bacterium]|nr:hypothetical protein [Candidatus Auribacterota bacterium]